MTRYTTLFLGGLLVSACGGGGGGSSVSPIAFAGTFTVAGAVPADAPDTCQTTTTVTFHADGTDRHTATLTGGDCLDFVNADTAPHQPAAYGTTAADCPLLDAPAALAKDAHYLAGPLGGPASGALSCQWEDKLHPIPAGGGGGGGGGPGY